MKISDTDIELDIIGGMAADMDYRYYALSCLTPDDFTLQVHRLAYNIIEQNQDDRILLGEILRQCGSEFAKKISDRFPGSIQKSCQLLRGYTLHRKRQQLARKLLSIDYREINLDEIQAVTAAFSQIDDLEIKPDPDIKEFVERAIDKATDAYDSAHRTTPPKGYPLFLPQMENNLQAVQPGEYWIIAGRPGHGKSTFCLNMALHGADHGHCPLVVTLEMPPEDHLIRAACRDTKINAAAVRRGAIESSTYLKLCETIQSYADKNIVFLDLDNIKIDALCRRIVGKVREKRCTAIFLDQINNIDYGNTKPYTAVTEISNKLRGLAKQLNLPLVVVSQLNREVEKRGKETKISDPKLSDLRESGALEQDAVTVILLNWPNRMDHSKPLNEYTVRIAKSRYGQVGYLKNVKIYPDISLIRQERDDERGPYAE